MSVEQVDLWVDHRGASPSIDKLSRRFPELDGGIVDHWFGPEANAENKTKRDVKKCQAAPQSGVISDASNDQRHHRSADDPRS
jgi:hypothetical protein